MNHKLSIEDHHAIGFIAETIRRAVLRKEGQNVETMAQAVAERVEAIIAAMPNQAEPEPALLTIEQAAKVLGITKLACKQRIKRGTIRGVRRFGRSIRIDRRELLRGRP